MTKSKAKPRILPPFAEVPETGCIHPHHEKVTARVDRNYTYWYSDSHVSHGVPLEGPVCYECFAWHILEHYPNSPVADHIRTNPNDYKNKYWTPWI